ncbi:ABC transporter substrate-binding protein [Paenibacillaceae bacterium WGS1546]|uniref:ABC transporter substrate-binding protein n=1 Tax=Cohnella sp. WGS1546 TaxID=3366810 RepID=UPI00372D5D18
MQGKWEKPKPWTVRLAALVIFALIVTGCGGNSGKDAGPSGSVSPGASASGGEPTGSADPAPAEKVTLEFWAQKFEDSTDAWFKKWTQEFNKAHDNIEVKLTIVPGDAWAQKMKAAQAAGKAPDIRTISYGNIANAAKMGEILPLNDLMDPAAFDDLYDNVKEFVAAGGKYYAYPKLVEPSTVLFYRKDMFKEAGLDPEKPPATWAEVLEYGKALTTKGVFGFSIAQNAGDLGWSSWGLQYNAAGHLAITDDWSRADIDNDGYRALVNFYKQAYESGIMPKQQLAGYTDIKPFGEGKLAMQVIGSWAIGQLRNDYKDILDQVGIAPMASIDGDPTKPTATLGGWTLAVDGKSKHAQEAADYISYLLAGDPAIMIDFFKGSQFSKFSARQSVDEAMKADPEASQDEWRAIVAEKIIPYSKAEPIYPWDISFALSTAIESAMRGAEVDKALAQAEKDINDYIAKSNLAGTNPNS